MKNVKLLALLAAMFSIGAMAQHSDPGGAWSTCKHYTGKVITVQGSTCPSGWLKQY